MQENDYLLLLNKKFTGEINARELQILEAWIEESPRHAELASQYAQIWNQAPARDRQFSLDMEAEFRELKRRIARREEMPAKTASIGQRWIRVAASVVFLLAAVLVYREFKPATANMIVVEAGHLDKRKIDLPDGSRVWLRGGGALKYPKVFTGELREVELDGEAYFEVAHRPDQPFRVELPDNGSVEVLGTEFNVKYRAGEPEPAVLVRSGAVRFSPQGMKNGPVLKGGEKAVFKPGSAQLIRSNVHSFNELAWQSGRLEFVRAPMREVVADLEQYYGVKITVRNTALLDCLHTSPLMADQPVEKALETLSTIYQLKVSNPAPGQYMLEGGIACR
ncbi:MAG: FecR domain-containing protein [Thermoanaerobaculia bacterium]|nr:FecR domain-containing protein [Thermoanaerobaculia bacterium]